MPPMSVDPTQHECFRHRVIRCEHGYMVEAQICPTCFPSPRCEDPEEISETLHELAKEQNRVRTKEGRFKQIRFYRCWGCKQPKPMDEKHFRRCASKATGFQTRCKWCDNRIKTLKRQKKTREQIREELSRGSQAA